MPFCSITHAILFNNTRQQFELCSISALSNEHKNMPTFQCQCPACTSGSFSPPLETSLVVLARLHIWVNLVERDPLRMTGWPARPRLAVLPLACLESRRISSGAYCDYTTNLLWRYRTDGGCLQLKTNEHETCLCPLKT